MTTLVPIELIASKIYLIRSVKVVLDRDLAELYGVETKALKQAVRRNIDRFPADFMFEMTNTEFEDWRSQFVTSKRDKMGLRYKPMAFTEQGVVMFTPLNAQLI
jgi:ORF6N domain